MAVIVTDMEVPPTCNHCKLCIKGKVTDYGQYGECILTNKKVNLMTWNIDAVCPLKSADEMIREIEEKSVKHHREIDNTTYETISLDVLTSIIYRYTNKEKDK